MLILICSDVLYRIILYFLCCIILSYIRLDLDLLDLDPGPLRLQRPCCRPRAQPHGARRRGPPRAHRVVHAALGFCGEGPREEEAAAHAEGGVSGEQEGL